ncbi:MAG: hypothetical protein ACK559_03170 [bacterium]
MSSRSSPRSNVRSLLLRLACRTSAARVCAPGPSRAGSKGTST